MPKASARRARRCCRSHSDVHGSGTGSCPSAKTTLLLLRRPQGQRTVRLTSAGMVVLHEAAGRVDRRDWKRIRHCQHSGTATILQFCHVSEAGAHACCAVLQLAACST